MKPQIPVTLLTGFLGAGKTTLLNRILTQNHGRRYAVVVNEFGEIGIDGDLIVQASEEMVQMSNGCICCTVRGDLARAVTELTSRPDRFDAIIVESTGLADPAPVAQTFLADDMIRERSRLDAVIALVDAKHLPLQLRNSPEAEAQIAFADIVILNKADLVGEEDLEHARHVIKEINPGARIHIATRADLDLTQILDCGAFDLQRSFGTDHHFHDETACGPDCDHHHHHDHLAHHDHEHEHERRVKHDGAVRSASFRSGELDAAEFFRWIQDVTDRRGQDIMRMKGILAFKDDPDRYVIQGVHMVLEGDHQQPWKEDERRESRLVFIGRNLDEHLLRRGFESCGT
ncbi:CobW family GTP-binding protein [Taklimakanibacter lacteus]|uniref:CobW family GTP-binding protein n=1 Tax=Taklimakanibacter lacteus TaxID=2268456 RepID=UPI000E663EAA